MQSPVLGATDIENQLWHTLWVDSHQRNLAFRLLHRIRCGLSLGYLADATFDDEDTDQPRRKSAAPRANSKRCSRHRQGRTPSASQRRCPTRFEWVVNKQIDCGVDIINDGEYVKAADPGTYAGYIHARVTGCRRKRSIRRTARKRAGVAERDRRDFPGFYDSGLWFAGSGGPVRPGFFNAGRIPPQPTAEARVHGPVTYTGHAAIAKDIDALKKALEGKSGVDGFIARSVRSAWAQARATCTTRTSTTTCSRSPMRARRNTRRSPTPA